MDVGMHAYIIHEHAVQLKMKYDVFSSSPHAHSARVSETCIQGDGEIRLTISDEQVDGNDVL